jgi:hypothetical protein
VARYRVEPRKFSLVIPTQNQQVGGMSQFRVLSASEQVAKHLREELARGTWTGVMPGEFRQQVLV